MSETPAEKLRASGSRAEQSASSGTAIRLENISKRYTQGKEHVQALTDISLTVSPGEILGIIGQSGAGKSTLIRMMNGLDTPTAGNLFLDEQDITKLGKKEIRGIQKNIGMIFQHFNLMNARTVAGNIAYPLALAGLKKEQRRKRIAELLDFIDLSDKANSYPDQLSGGQKQRVGIARALANNPHLLLADEATSALDPETTDDVLELLRKINRQLGVTIVLVTHEMNVVQSLADKVAVMQHGSVVEYGSVRQVFAHPQQEITRRFIHSALRDRPNAGELESIRGDIARVRQARGEAEVTAGDTVGVLAGVSGERDAHVARGSESAVGSPASASVPTGASAEPVARSGSASEPYDTLLALSVNDRVNLSDFFALANEHAVTLRLVHGSVHSLQEHSFGTLTFHAHGTPEAVRALTTHFSAHGDCEVIGSC